MEKTIFNIDHIDSLGQGVSKVNETVFVAKALPGESGTARIYRRAKGVAFGFLADPADLEITSPRRMPSPCRSFNSCNGCQYLHTSYNHELEIKKEQLSRMFRGSEEAGGFQIISTENRFEYRNRVQLHYDTETEKLGYIDVFNNSIISAGECLLPEPEIKNAIEELYRDRKWISLLPAGSPQKGYFEIYRKSREEPPVITVNSPYAGGGFTQVNNLMGNQLRKKVTEMYDFYLEGKPDTTVLDIFGGNGFLSADITSARTITIDKNVGKNRSHGEQKVFINFDLYRKNTVPKLKSRLGQYHIHSPELIIFDPPRTGVKNIREYADTFRPEYIFYVSCNPSTLKRDMKNISDLYNPVRYFMIDMFPGTRHFETFIIFKKQEKG